jgi:RNA polymerase sigma-70 factor (ECF subfamily)
MDFHKLSDIALMEEIKAGRKEAFAALVSRHQKPLLNFFRRLGAYRDEAEDLVQDTFLRVFRHRYKYEPRAKFTTFLYALARNAWADAQRKMKRWPSNGNEKIVDKADSREDAQTETELKMDIQAAIDRLPEELRLTVILSVYQGMKYKEIAEVLNMPEGTVKSRMFYALRKLRELLDENSRPG